MISRKNAVVTGCNGQIGRKLMQELMGVGYYVYGIDIDVEPKVNEIFHISKIDITSVDEVKNFFLSLANKEISINTLVNNAGIGVFSDYIDRTKDEFMKVLEVNLFGTFNLINQAIERMEYLDAPSNIVNVGSIYGVVSSDPEIYGDLNRKNSEVYSASKAGIIQLTKYFSVHLAKKNICVNCISPGGVFNNHPQNFLNNYSRKTPLNRMANVDEIVGAMLIFCKNTNQYLTGQNLVVDGGYTSW